MREIKFRAWNEKHKIWYEPGLLSVCGDGEIDFGGAVAMNIKLEFYTGLKDKNGKEIYEGDVVDVHIFGFNGNETEHEFRAVIEWCEEFAGVGLRVIENISSSLGKGGLNPIASIYGMHEESFTVIGNVHENPELTT